MAKVNPPARHVPRKGDEVVSLEQIRRMTLFEARSQDNIERDPIGGFPGAIILRRFRRDQTIVVQGEVGWTLFYVLTTADLRELRQSQQLDREDENWQDRTEEIAELLARESDINEIKEAIEQMRDRLGQHLEANDTDAIEDARRQIQVSQDKLDSMTQVASVSLTSSSDSKNHSHKSVDTPTNSIHEGELFGEMSCLYRTPRSATVVATRDCFALEMLRNVYDRLGHTKKFKAQMEAIQWEQIVRLNLRDHLLFRSLTQDEFDRLEPEIRSSAQPISVKAGEIICDEFERADSLYIVRSGYVKVATNVSSLLRASDVKDWRLICKTLTSTEQENLSDAGPMHLLRSRVNDSPAFDIASRAAETGEEVETLSKAEQLEILHSLNNLLGDEKSLWAALCSTIAKGAPPKTESDAPADDEGTVLQGIWQQVAISQPKAFQEAVSVKKCLEPELISLIVDAVNQETGVSGQAVITNACDLQSPLLMDTAVLAGLNPYQRLRYMNRAVLCSMLPSGISPVSFAAPPRTIGYQKQGEFIGEIGVIGTGDGPSGEINMVPRTATCLAYDHPIAGNQPGDVQLVRIDADLIHRIYTKSSQLREAMAETIKARLERTARQDVSLTATSASSSVPLETIDELGLVQGNKLMLIDLDRCTRCNECVDACVQTHRQPKQSDPFSYPLTRLYLDGPRAGRHLVPATCRQCTDPVCLIGCPVGSIHKGDLGQIVIDDWCVGCTICARNCPYDAIQMHHLGLIQRGTGTWHYRPSPVNDGWTQGNRTDRWQTGRTPFYFDAEFRYGVRETFGRLDKENRLHFLAGFDVGRSDIDADQFLLQIESVGKDAQAWLNGVPVELKFKRVRERDVVWHYQASLATVTNPPFGWQHDSPKGGLVRAAEQIKVVSLARQLYDSFADGENESEALEKATEALKDQNITATTGGEWSAELLKHVLAEPSIGIPAIRPGKNYIAVSLLPQPNPAEAMFDLGIYPVMKSAETEGFLGEVFDWDEKFIMQRAIVCDMCASTPSRTPSCVAACPHDAAWRGTLDNAPFADTQR